MDAATNGHRNLRRSRYGLRAAVALLMGLALAGRLSAATEPASSSTERVLEEVVIEGMAAWQLQQVILETEDRFFALYNELNDRNDFDVHCTLRAPTGTRLRQRSCNAVYFDRAQKDEARQFLEGVSAHSPRSIELLRGEEFRRHLLEVADGDSRLRKLLRDRDLLMKRYRAILDSAK